MEGAPGVVLLVLWVTVDLVVPVVPVVGVVLVVGVVSSVNKCMYKQTNMNTLSNTNSANNIQYTSRM